MVVRVPAVSILVASLALAAAAPAARADYPERPVRFVVAFAPGGIADLTARIVVDQVAARLGQPVIIENRGGAGGNIAAAAVARAPADGYTVLVTTTSVAVNPALDPKAGYDLARELLPVANIASSPNVIVAHPGVAAGTLPQAIAAAKGAKYSFGSPGVGSTSHLTGEYLFNTLSKADVVHVAFRGGNPAVAASVGGQTQFTVVPVPVAAAQIKAGRLKALAVTGAARDASLPQVPTVSESGFAGYVDATWVGLFLPAGAPPQALVKLNDAVNQALRQPAVRERLAAQSLVAAGGTPGQFAAFVQGESDKWAKVVRDTGVKPE